MTDKHEIKHYLSRIPKTRTDRMEVILANIQAHPEGLNIQYFINQFTWKFGIKRKEVESMMKDMERAGLIRVNRLLRVVAVVKEKKKVTP